MGKPNTLTLLYGGDGGHDAAQPIDSVEVIVDPLYPASFPNPAVIDVVGIQRPTLLNIGTYEVAVGGTFSIMDPSKPTITPRTAFYIRDEYCTLVQEVQFHTSCSQPLEYGDEYGGIVLWGSEYY